MKLATFNIQNLFHRDISFNETQFDKTKKDWEIAMDELMDKPIKSIQDQERLRELVCLADIDNINRYTYAVLRRKGGYLFLKGKNYSKELKASELTDWNGWIALQNYPLDPIAVKNKARVIAEVNPDILILQEIEDRASLAEFNEDFLPRLGCEPFQQTFVVQGNDNLGREIGILIRKGFQIKSVRSHIYDLNFQEKIVFEKDLLQYEIQTANGKTIWILATHLKNQAGDKNLSNKIRTQQAKRIAEVYKQMKAEGKINVAIVGTLNAPSFCNSLSPLLLKTNVLDISKHSDFNVDFDKGEDAGYYSLGAYRMGVNIKQKDYLLLSPELFKKTKRSGLNRKGVWPEKRPTWSIYPGIDQKSNAASEHPIVWADVEV
ncbi:endonuclease/exonuclease/phosphatase family protein [Salegentibacter maritimus]|uniref:endonuclease/exonuclease/phosphatase family protein n=1 Tax=Salegentibacter maritimus TaxID=2794347 RepID=UPI0018E4A8DA|nr:hypothetical protein [Salegentibacter maritimus]MBI6116010.1 hypothetical protein [Salegentibacter maritimus]